MQEGVVCRDTRGWGKELICYVYVKPASFSCCKLCDLSFIVKSINDCETRPLLLDVAQSRTSLSVIKELGFDWNSAWYVFLKKGSSEPKIDLVNLSSAYPTALPALWQPAVPASYPWQPAGPASYPWQPAVPSACLWCLRCPLSAPWQRVVPACHCQEKNKKISVFQASQRKIQGDSLGLKKAFLFAKMRNFEIIHQFSRKLVFAQIV
jgi:hypothetical protein